MEKRLCNINGKIGYFHRWENFSKPLEASPLVSGAPAGIFSKTYAIVEFPDCVKRVDPTQVLFCDEQNQALWELNKKGGEE